MKTILHKADTRGNANHGWLHSRHTFSFANYHNPERVHFGVLRVLNDDVVQGGMGFGTHAHDNMEIISIPLEGALEHKDSMGSKTVIHQNDVQIMSAGTGVFHSEYNHHADQPVNFLQIWVFPKEKNIKPRYDQITFNPEERVNRWQRVVSPTEEGAVWINQDAYFSLGRLIKDTTLDYEVAQPGNGVYVFVLKGNVTVGDQALHQRDGLGIWSTEKITVQADSDAEVLLMDIPMSIN